MCAGLMIAAVLICLSSAQTSVEYHEEDSESVRAGEREIQQQPVGETGRERLRLAALEAELQEELKLAQHANNEEDGLGAIPGQPGQDYPVYASVPRTSFTCADKLLPGYYADVHARCQVFHICDTTGAKHSFLCPRGSLFNQKYLVCDWWYTSECDPADQHGFNRLDHSKETDFLPDNQYFSNPEENYILLQSDIFHSAETGVPNREKYERSKGSKNNNDYVRPNSEDENRRFTDASVGNSTSKPEVTTKSIPRKQFQKEDHSREYF